MKARLLMLGVLIAACSFATVRPETLAFPYKVQVSAVGTYANSEAAVGMDYVVSGDIEDALSFSSDVPYRVTLSGATVSAPITLKGEAVLWLIGENTIATTEAQAVTA